MQRMKQIGMLKHVENDLQNDSDSSLDAHVLSASQWNQQHVQRTQQPISPEIKNLHGYNYNYNYDLTRKNIKMDDKLQILNEELSMSDSVENIDIDDHGQDQDYGEDDDHDQERRNSETIISETIISYTNDTTIALKNGRNKQCNFRLRKHNDLI